MSLGTTKPSHPGLRHSVLMAWGICCPNCQRDDCIEVAVRIWALFTRHGETDADSAENRDHDWDDDSACACTACRFVGKVRDFRIENDPYRQMNDLIDADAEMAHCFCEGGVCAAFRRGEICDSIPF